jgi:hypothetical protein
VSLLGGRGSGGNATEEAIVNVKLLRKIQRKIKAYPKTFAMCTWTILRPKSASRPCGMTACIGGWAIHLSSKKAMTKSDYEMENFSDTARTLLDIGLFAGARLFHVGQWPSDLRERLLEHGDETPEFAAIACERIDRFIATNGDE